VVRFKDEISAAENITSLLSESAPISDLDHPRGFATG
jgi:hypothetical protein